MAADDRAHADALDRAWDELVGSPKAPRQNRAADPDLTAVPRALAALDRASAPRYGQPPAWDEIAPRAPEQPVRGRRRGRTLAMLPAETTIAAPAMPSAAPARRSPPRWWPPLEFAAGVSLIAALLAATLGWHRDPTAWWPPGQGLGSFGGRPDDRPAAVPSAPVAAPCGEILSVDAPEPATSPRWDHSATAAEFNLVVEPVAAGDTVVVGGSATYGEGVAALIAYDAKTGVERWRTEPGQLSGVMVDALVAWPTMVFFSTDAGVVAAIDPASGDIQWHRDFGAQGHVSFALALGDDGTTLFAADGGRGEMDIPRIVGLDATGAEVVATANAPGGRLLAFSAADGEVVWESPIDVLADADGEPGPSLVAYDWASGNALWGQAFPTNLSAPTIGDGTVFVTAGENTFALTVAGGVPLWQSPAPGSVPPLQFRSPAGISLGFAGGLLYVSGKRAVAALDAGDGTALWCAKVADPLHLVVADAVYVGSPSGVDALDRKTGALRWGIASWVEPGSLVGAEPNLYPTVADGALYVNDWVGRVVAHEIAGDEAAT